MSIETINKFTEDVAAKAELQRVEMGRVALQDIKTLDRMLKESKDMAKENKKIGDKRFDAEDKRVDLQKEYEADERRWNLAKQDVDKVKADNAKRIEAADKKVAKELGVYKKSMEKYYKAYDVEVKMENEYNAQQQKSETFATRFTTAIKEFNNAAKALGVKVDTGKYTTAANIANRI